VTGVEDRVWEVVACEVETNKQEFSIKRTVESKKVGTHTQEISCIEYVSERCVDQNQRTKGGKELWDGHLGATGWTGTNDRNCCVQTKLIPELELF